MPTRLVRPAAALLLGALGAWCFLRWNDAVVEWIPRPLVSGSYNLILSVVGLGFGLLIYRLLRLGEGPVPRTKANFSLTAHGSVRMLAVVAGSLVWINCLDVLLKLAVEYEYRKVMPLFALEMEGNVPTFFSAVLLLLCAALLALVSRAGRKERRDRLTWFSLACLFAFLALDEFAAIHERLVPLGRSLLSGSRAFGREWILLYGVLLIPIGLFYLPFLRRLPPVTRRLWVVAGIVFLSGALVLELLSGWYGLREAAAEPLQAALNIGKEALEMTGVLIFLYGLLDYMEREVGRIGLLPAARDG